jgi:hypothetical protein
MKTPQGVEKVVALATLSPEWRKRVLADPLAAAAEAGIELAPSECEILRAVEPRALAAMVDSFGKSLPRPAGLGKLAAGAAVVALLSSTLIGCDGCGFTRGTRPDQPPPNPNREEPPPPATKGIRPDIPPEKDAPKSPQPPPPAPDK